MMDADTENREELTAAPDTYLCFRGIERSRIAAKALGDAGISAKYLEGGTLALLHMSDDQIEGLIPRGSRVRIIYDQRSPHLEHQAYKKAVERLTTLGLKVESIDTAALFIELYGKGVDPSNYF